MTSTRTLILLIAAGGATLLLARACSGAGASSTGNEVEKEPAEPTADDYLARGERPPAALLRERTRRRMPQPLPPDQRTVPRTLRATSDAFFDHNLEIARERAASDGITLEELRQLTYLGQLATRTLQWGAVEAAIGRALPAEAKANAEALMMSASNDLKAAIREHVAQGDPVEARWRTIRESERSYLAEYYAVTGMNEELLGQLLGDDPNQEMP